MVEKIVEKVVLSLEWNSEWWADGRLPRFLQQHVC